MPRPKSVAKPASNSDECIGSLVSALGSTTGLPKELFGSDAIPQLTLILGAAAISLLLVGVAGLVTGLPLARAIVDGKEQTCPRAFQFAIGAGLSAAAAALQIWALTTALSRLDIPVLGVLITGGQIVALCVAACYLAVSVHHYVTTYGKEPAAADATPSDELVATLTQFLLPAYQPGAPPNDDDVTDAGRKAHELACQIAQEIDAAGAAQPSSAAGPRVLSTFTRSLI